MTKKHAPQYFICNLNFKSHNFQTESPFKHVAPTYRGSPSLSFFSPWDALCLGHFEFKILLMLSSALSKRPKCFCTRPSNWLYMWDWHKQVFLGPRFFCILWISKPPFKRLGSYKFCQSLLSRNPCLVPDSGIMPKWVPPSSLQMGWRTWSARKGSYPPGHPSHMYLRLTSSPPKKNLKFSRSSFRASLTSVCPFSPVGTMRNTLHTSLQSSKIIVHKGLSKRCRMLAKAVNRRSKGLKNLQEATGSQDTVSTNVDVMACKVEIEQTQQMLQEAQKAHDKAIVGMYKQLRNLLSHDVQCQWDRVCRKMHKCDLWAAVNSQVTKGRHLQTWTSFLDCLELHKLTVFSADAAKRQRFYIQQAVRKPQSTTVQQHISCMWECWMTTSNTSLCWRTAPRLYHQQRKGRSLLVRLI